MRELALAVLLSACGGQPPTLLTPAGDAAPLPPDTAVPLIDGQSLGLDSLRGQVLLLDFWATWCVPCTDALPAYGQIHDRLGSRGFTVVAVSVDEDPGAVQAFLRAHPLPYHVAIEPQADLAGRLGVQMLPTTFLVDREGRIRKRYDGFEREALPALEAAIEALLEDQ